MFKCIRVYRYNSETKKEKVNDFNDTPKYTCTLV